MLRATMYARNTRFTAPNAESEARVDALLARLTIEEKIDLIGGDPKSGATRAAPRAGIPAFKMADGPVGVHWWCDASTAYPAVLCAVASWDRELVQRLGVALGRDCRARGVHYLLAPGVNIYRSALCGRNFEYMGEDPYLASRMVVEYVRGVQAMGVATTVKHYALNFQEYARHTVSSDADERTLREVYLPAFEAAIREGGSAALMTAYNLVNGQHCSEHPELIRTILKEEWGFDGLVMSDWDSCYSPVGCANAGLDLEMPFAKVMTREKLLPAIERGQVTIATIDDKVRRLLRVAVSFGWLDHDQRDETIPLDDPATEQVALDVARSGFVLLKNEKDILPLEGKKLSRLAVIGGHAHPAVICAGGSAYTTPYRTTSILEGLREVAGDGVRISHEVGLDPDREYTRGRDSQFETVAGEPGVSVTYFKNDKLEGEPALARIEARLFLEAGKVPAEGFGQSGFGVRYQGRVRPKTSGQHRFYVRSGISPYRLYLNGELVVDAWSNPASQNKLVTLDRDLAADQTLDFTLEYARVHPWEEIVFGWESVADIAADYERALTEAEKADAVVLCVGFTRYTESEGFDRSFGLPEAVERLVNDVARVNSRTIVLLMAGGGVDMSRWLDSVRGLVHVFYPGQNGGRAAAEILFGNINPSGKLPFTIERELDDRGSTPSYHDADGDKRVFIEDGIFTGYRHFDRSGKKPLFPFGYGLSYSEFKYGKLALSSQTITADDRVTVSFEIKNESKRAGAEVAQLYVRDVRCSRPRPEKELKGFAKVFLEPGEKKTVELVLERRALQFFDPDQKRWLVEPGKFEVLVGRSATDIELRETFKVV